MTSSIVLCTSQLKPRASTRCWGNTLQCMIFQTNGRELLIQVLSFEIDSRLSIGLSAISITWECISGRCNSNRKSIRRLPDQRKKRSVTKANVKFLKQTELLFIIATNVVADL